jgi:hypothetical protein
MNEHEISKYIEKTMLHLLMKQQQNFAFQNQIFHFFSSI